MGPVDVHPTAVVSDGVVLGHPGKEDVDLLRTGDMTTLPETRVGADSLIRHGSVIYAGVKLGKEVKTGHDVLIREDSTIGDRTMVGSGTIIEARCRVGTDVSIQSGVFLANGTVVKDEVFLGPHTCVLNDRMMDGNIEPVLINEGARLGANCTILAGVEIGKEAVIGAGTVVTKDVPDGETFVGVPGTPI